MLANQGLFIAAVLLDTLGTTLFKLGARPQPTAVAHTSLRWPSWSPRWPVVLGVLVYAVEYVLWITFLSQSALSQAFPMYSLTIVLILAVSKYLLGEPVGRNRWVGAGLIVAGVWMCGGAA